MANELMPLPANAYNALTNLVIFFPLSTPYRNLYQTVIYVSASDGNSNDEIFTKTLTKAHLALFSSDLFLQPDF